MRWMLSMLSFHFFQHSNCTRSQDEDDNQNMPSNSQITIKGISNNISNTNILTKRLLHDFVSERPSWMFLRQLPQRVRDSLKKYQILYFCIFLQNSIRDVRCGDCPTISISSAFISSFLCICSNAIHSTTCYTGKVKVKTKDTKTWEGSWLQFLMHPFGE